MKILTILALILASSLSFASGEVDCCHDDQPTSSREPMIREIR